MRQVSVTHTQTLSSGLPPRTAWDFPTPQQVCPQQAARVVSTPRLGQAVVYFCSPSIIPLAALAGVPALRFDEMEALLPFPRGGRENQIPTPQRSLLRRRSINSRSRWKMRRLTLLLHHHRQRWCRRDRESRLRPELQPVVDFPYRRRRLPSRLLGRRNNSSSVIRVPATTIQMR